MAKMDEQGGAIERERRHPSLESQLILIDVLQDASRDTEVRAGAAWGLGQFASSESAVTLVDTFNSSPLEVKTEAARALLRITEPQVSRLVDLLQTINPAKRDGLSWALARTGGFNPTPLLEGADDNLRRWVSYMVGYGRDNFTSADIQSICETDKEVYFAASVLWQVIASWVDGLSEY